MNSSLLPSHLIWPAASETLQYTASQSTNPRCDAVLSNHVSTEVHDLCNCIIFLSPHHDLQSKVCMTKKAEPLSKLPQWEPRWAFKYRRVAFEVKKERSVEQKGWKKKTVHPHFPSFSQSLCVSVNLLSLDETQRLQRRKAPGSPRLPHTQIFSLEPAVGATNPMSTLP